MSWYGRVAKCFEDDGESPFPEVILLITCSQGEAFRKGQTWVAFQKLLSVECKSSFEYFIFYLIPGDSWCSVLLKISILLSSEMFLYK